MTLKLLKARAALLGYSVTKNDGEYRIAPRLDHTKRKFPLRDRLAFIEASAYYTNDLDDAYETLLLKASREDLVREAS